MTTPGERSIIAFQTAREVAPTAKLYYNDFSTTDTTKLGFIAALVSGKGANGEALLNDARALIKKYGG